MSIQNFLALFALLFFSGCVTTSGPNWLPVTFSTEKPLLAQLDPEKSTEGWKKIGGEVDRKVAQSDGMGLIELEGLEGFLNDQIKKMKEAIGFEKIPGKVYILASPSMNARTTADGNIYVPIGMIMDVESNDEMLALLAHELAHTILNHTDTDLLADIQKKGIAAWAVINQVTGDTEQNSSLNRRARNALAFSLAADKIINPTWNRKQEQDADRLAVDILVSMGRDPNAMIVLLGKLDRWEEINKSLMAENGKMSSMLVEAMVSRFAENQWQAELMRVFAPLGAKIESEIDDLANTHMSPEERMVDVRAYIRQHHRDADMPNIEVRSWKKVAHNSKVRQHASAVKTMNEAHKLVVSGNVQGAEKLIRRFRTPDVQNQAYYKIIQAIIAEEREAPEQVLAITSSSNTLQYPSYRLLVMHQGARQQLQPAGSVDQLKSLYAQFDTYGRPPEYYADLIRMADQTDDVPFKYEMILRCYAAYFGNKAACGSESEVPQASGGGAFLGGAIKLFGL